MADDWKSRSTLITEQPSAPEASTNDWKSRSAVVDHSAPFELAPQPTPLDSFLAGASNVAELKPAIKAAVAEPRGALQAVKEVAPFQTVKMLSALLGTQPSDAENFRKARTAANAEEDVAYEANPSMYNLGAAPRQLLEGAVLPEIKSPVLAGGLIGAIPAAGEAISKGQDLRGATANVGLSTLTGMGAGKALGFLGNKLNPKALQNFADEQSVKAIGLNKRGAERAIEQNRIGEMGQDLLQPNPYTAEPIVTGKSTPTERLERAKQTLEGAGNNIKKTLTTFDSQTDPEIRQYFVNPEEIAQHLESLREPHLINGQPSQTGQENLVAIDKLIADVRRYGQAPIPFSEAQHMKELATSGAFGPNGVVKNEYLAKARGMINDAMEGAADRVAMVMGDSGVAERYFNDKGLYRTALDAVSGSRGQVASDLTKKAVGFDHAIVSSVGHALGGAPGAAAGLLVKHATGSARLAAGAQKLVPVSEAVTSVGNKLITAPKAKVVEAGQALSNSGIPGVTTLGDLMTKVGSNNDLERNAALNVIMQNHSFRTLINNMTEDKE